MFRIIFHFFCFYYAEMRRKLGLGQMSKTFEVYFIHINFFKTRNKKIFNRAKKLYCDATIFVCWFFIVYLPKKNGNWKIAQGEGNIRAFYSFIQVADVVWWRRTTQWRVASKVTKCKTTEQANSLSIHTYIDTLFACMVVWNFGTSVLTDRNE